MDTRRASPARQRTIQKADERNHTEAQGHREGERGLSGYLLNCLLRASVPLCEILQVLGFEPPDIARTVTLISGIT